MSMLLYLLVNSYIILIIWESKHWEIQTQSSKHVYRGNIYLGYGIQDAHAHAHASLVLFSNHSILFLVLFI